MERFGWKANRDREAYSFSSYVATGIGAGIGTPEINRGAAWRRILVVDDNLANLTMLQAMLEAWGYFVTTAESGKEALKLLRISAEAGKAFDLVVLDVQMPYMDGIQVAQIISEEDIYGSPPIVLASSLGTRNEMARNRDIQCAACLTKPLKQSVLRDTLVWVLSPASATSSP